MMANEGEQRTIIIVGPTGHGKSTLANAIVGVDTQNLQNPVFFAHPGNQSGRVTLEPQVHGARIGEVYVRVIDTPGLFDDGVDINSRWTGILKAVLIGQPQIDAIVAVVDSHELHSGAKCLNKIHESLGSLTYGRFITCFTKQMDSTKTEQHILAEFNGHLEGGSYGSLWMFSDQNADSPTREQKMVDLLGKVEEIREQDWPQLTKDTFKKQTLLFFEECVNSRKGEVSYQSLSDSGMINVDLIQKFLLASEMEEIMEIHNRRKRAEEKERMSLLKQEQEKREKERQEEKEENEKREKLAARKTWYWL